MRLTVRPVATKTDLDAFITLPRRLYAGQRGYVPPLDLERRQLLDPARSGFHTHGEAAYFLAERGGQPVGRISAQIDQLATGPAFEGVGFFGCLDTADDPPAIAALISMAESWLIARGRTIARGPFLLSINGESGLLLDGHEEPPMLLMPWHPRWLAGGLSAAGYDLVKRLNSSVIDIDAKALAARLGKLGIDRRRQAFDVRPLRMGKGMAEDIESGRLLFNDAWQDNWGFLPVTAEEMRRLVDGFRHLLRPENGVFVYRNGDLVGFSLFLPNIFDVAADLGGLPGAVGWLKLAFRTAIGKFTSGRIVLFGVVRDLIGSASGASVALVLVDELVRRSVKTRYRRVECGWILDDNIAMQTVVDWFGAKPSRVFGVFEKKLASGLSDAARD